MKTHTFLSPNSLRSFSSIQLSFLALCACVIAANAAVSLLPNVSRYSSVGDSLYTEESGGLYRNGNYKPVRSLTSTLTPEDKEQLQAIDGRPVISVDQFDLYQANGLIPSWVTFSVQSYPFLYNDFVILSVKGGPDPNPPPVFFDEPQSQVVFVGRRLVLSGLADPFELVTYQWLKNGKPISDETESRFIIESCKKSDKGSYSLRASLGTASAVSSVAKITVVQEVAIRRDLQNMTVQKGKHVTLRVSATGTGPFTYEWFKSGHLVDGLNRPRLVMKSVSEMDAGFYFVRVRSPYSVTDSSYMTLIVTQ
jgi:hypothetical protein